MNLTTLEGKIVLACIPAEVGKESGIIYHVMVSGILLPDAEIKRFAQSWENKAVCSNRMLNSSG